MKEGLHKHVSESNKDSRPGGGGAGNKAGYKEERVERISERSRCLSNLLGFRQNSCPAGTPRHEA